MMTRFEREQLAKDVAAAISEYKLLSLDDMMRITGKSARGVKDMCRRPVNPLPCHIRQGAWVFKQSEISAYFSAENDELLRTQ